MLGGVDMLYSAGRASVVRGAFERVSRYKAAAAAAAAAAALYETVRVCE